MLQIAQQMIATPNKLFTNLRDFSLLRTAAGSLGLKIVAAGLGFVNGILLARLLGPADYGVYSIALSLIYVAAALAALGLPTLATREAAANTAQGRWERLKGFQHAAHRWTLMASLTILAVTAILLTSGLVKPTVSWATIFISMTLVPLIAFNQLRAAILRGFNWVILADIPDLLLRPVVVFLFLGAAYLTATRMDAANALGILLGATMFSLALGTWWLRTRQPALLITATSAPPTIASLIGALPFLAIALISTLESQVSLYMLGYLGGAMQAGLFQAAAQLVGLIAVGLAAINMPLQPRLAAAWARGDKQQTQRLVTETARMGTAIALIGGLIIMAFAEELLRLYGAEYSDAAIALRILAVGQIINAASGSCGTLLMMTGHQGVVLLGTTFALLLNCLVAYLAIPHFGLVGGAMAAMLSSALWNAYFVTYSFFKLHVNTTIAS